MKALLTTIAIAIITLTNSFAGVDSVKVNSKTIEVYYSTEVKGRDSNKKITMKIVSLKQNDGLKRIITDKGHKIMIAGEKVTVVTTYGKIITTNLSK